MITVGLVKKFHRIGLYMQLESHQCELPSFVFFFFKQK